MRGAVVGERWRTRDEVLSGGSSKGGSVNEKTVAIVEVAQRATADGIAVVPVREDGSKRPDLVSWREYQTRLPTREELREWFAAYERTGVGWITGAVSGGLECIDFDSREAFEEYRALAEALNLEPVLRVLAAYHEYTPKGAHLYLRSDACEGNQKLARAEDGAVRIETRGEGGFVVVAPSHGGVHPSGEPYTAPNPFEQSTIAVLTADEREAVLSLARSLDKGTRASVEAATPANPARAGESTRPGDLFVARASWAQVLEPAGWRLIHRRGGEEYWRRPHAKTDGIDATTNYADSGLLYVFSTSGVPFEPERGYNLFSAYALLNHGGDYQAAARDLASQGYSEDVEPATDFGSGVKLAASVARPPDTSGRSASYRFAHGWPAGHFVARYIAYCAARTDASHEYHEASALALLGAATPNVRTYLDPWPDGIATNLYLILLGGTTSSRKSTALSFARRMMGRVDPSSVLAERMTPEAMIEQLAGRGRRGSLLVGDEFGEALASILQSSGYMAPLRELLLTIYGARRYKYSRRSKRGTDGEQHADTDEVLDPHLVMLTASTGAIFETLSSRDVQTGLMPRFGIVYPTSQPPRRPIYEHAEDTGEEEWLVDYLQRLYLWASQGTADNTDIVTRWSQAALEASDDAGRLVEEGTDEITQRLGGMAIKIAMLSALGEGVPQVKIVNVELRDAEQGARVVRRMEEAAIRFADQIGGLSADQRKTEQSIDRVRRMLRTSSGTAPRSTIGRTLKLSARQLDDLEATMVDRGIIKIMQDAADGPGRPAKRWGLQ